MSTFSHDFPFTAPAPVAAPRPLSNRDRRRAPRQTLVAKASLRSEVAPAGARPVFVSNISMLGVAFHTRIPLPLDERFQLKLEAGPMQWTSRVRVISCAPNPDGTYDIGAEFVGNELQSRTRTALAA